MAGSKSTLLYKIGLPTVIESSVKPLNLTGLETFAGSYVDAWELLTIKMINFRE